MLTEIRPGLWVCTRTFSDLSVNAVLILADRYALVVDTLLGVADMAPFLELIRRHRRPVLVINTHGDWDHILGNAAFSDVPIIAHRLCRERALRDGEEQVAEARIQFPHLDLSDPWVAPGLVFDSSLTLHAGDIRVKCLHVPGHTVDSIVVRIPEWGVCIAGDTVEDPIPTVDPGGSVRQLRQGVIRLLEGRNDLVIPGHGPVSGPQLMKTNLAYLDHLLSAPTGDRECPPMSEHTPTFYRQAHAANVAAARREPAD